MAAISQEYYLLDMHHRRQAPAERPTHCICRLPLPDPDRPGRKPKYCDNPSHSRIADAVGALRALLPESPEALLWVIEQLDEIKLTLRPFDPDEIAALRRAAFRLATRGTQLKPGSSGRYEGGLTRSEAGQVRAANMVRDHGRFVRRRDPHLDGARVTLDDLTRPPGVSASDAQQLAASGFELRREGGGVRLVRITSRSRRHWLARND